MILVLILVPLGLAAVLALLISRGKGPHPASYELSEPWRHSPILWAADEPAHQEHATGHSEHHPHPVTIGGGASGTW
ncbi:MAG: hypothetical protein SV966_12710 [Actinomycetota bacterium]|nr:hypothetical protein [Actinomycetota bacterium]